MLKKEDCFQFGILGKSVGLKGEMNLKIDSDNPSHYEGIDAMFLEIQGNLVPYFLEKFTVNNRGVARLKFEDINHKDEAQELTGTKTFLPAKALPELNDDQFYYHEIINYKVFDTNHGAIGFIQNVAENNSNPLFIINFNEKEILIPVSDEIITKVDKQKKEIHISAPEGLIELYLNE